MALILFFIISGISTLILVVMVIGLVRHAKVLARSLLQFQREMEPVMTEIRAQAEQARTRMEAAGEQAERLRDRSEPGRRR